MNYYKDRFNQVVSFDEIRIGKVIEIIQFSLIFTFLAVIASYLMNKYLLFSFTSKESFLTILITLSLELALLTLVIFYLRKITLMFPSISTFMFKNFKPYTTIDLGMWMVLVFVFTTTIDKLTNKVKILSNKFDEMIKHERLIE